VPLGDVEAMRPSRRMRNVEALQQQVMVRREVCSCGQQTWRFREPQCGDRYQDKRESPADDVDDRPAKALGQQERDDQTADKAAERRPGEGQHDHHRAQAMRRVIAGQRHRPGESARDSRSGEEARPRQEAKRRGKAARQRGDTEERETDQQQWLTPNAVADGAGGEGACHQADIRPQKGQREPRRCYLPSVGQRRHRPADRTDVVAVAHLNEGADQGDADLQAADPLIFQRVFGRG